MRLVTKEQIVINVILGTMVMELHHVPHVVPRKLHPQVAQLQQQVTVSQRLFLCSMQLNLSLDCRNMY